MVGTRQTSPRTRARAKTARTRLYQHPAAVEQRQEESAKTGTLFKRLSEEEAELVGCGESGATIILWCDWRDDVSFLNAFEEEAELNSFESKIAGVLVTGIDSGAARLVVPAGEILGYPVERDSETGRVYTSATGERVFDQEKQQIGNCGRQSARLEHASRVTSVYDMCAAGHRVVFDFDSNKRDLNKLTGERT